MKKSKNIDKHTVEGFGDEWERFDQQSLSKKEHQEIFESYFSIFPWHDLPSLPVGFDLGCGSGRWAKLIAPRVKRLHCIDPSSAIDIAKRNLANYYNCEFHHAGVDNMPLSAYRNRSFYTIRTDALDRFGTKLEQRFTKNEIKKMMETANLEKIVFSEKNYWCAVGYRKK